ncbi:uncharacterized protein LOC127860554 [Dreissena polymorpha]|uniref:uncharacterized protein LOC127860554 n=1 Tax=Dreissena polymorpha TaxID=45954 RepID=UPI0022644D51|nr:uncharacterized protein LOC127860554 [Dreissena polymorpha]
MKQNIAFAGFGLSCLNALFSILALALNAWIEYSDDDGRYQSSGLWKSCTGYRSVFRCVEILPVLPVGKHGQILAVRAFVAMGMLLMLGAAVTAGVRVFLMKDKRIIYLATVGLSIAAGFCLLVGFATYASEFGESVTLGRSKYAAGFALCVVAWLFSWVQAGMFFVHGRMPDSPA